MPFVIGGDCKREAPRQKSKITIRSLHRTLPRENVVTILGAFGAIGVEVKARVVLEERTPVSRGQAKARTNISRA